MNLTEIGRLFDRIVEYYPVFTGDMSKMKSWQEILQAVPYERACKNLLQYVSDADNKYPPHPGVLAGKEHSDADRYYERMHQSGSQVLASWEEMRSQSAGPTEEQRRKVRECLGK